MVAGCLWRSASALACHPPTLIDIATRRPRSPQYAPFIDDGDDFLSQICQMQIFFSLLSTIILQTKPNSPVMAVVLPILIVFPPVSGFIFESGVLDELKKISAPDDNGWPIPFSGGKRVGVGVRSKTTACLERLFGVKKALEEPDEDTDVAEATTASTSSLVGAVREAQTGTRLTTDVEQFDSIMKQRTQPPAAPPATAPPPSSIIVHDVVEDISDRIKDIFEPAVTPPAAEEKALEPLEA